MVSRNYRIWSHSILSCLLVFVVVILLNAALARTVVRADLTEEGLYTLSDGTKAILEGLRDPVTFEVYWGNAPQGVAPGKRYAEGLLDEIESIADGKITVRWIDTESTEGKSEASDANVTPYTYARNEGNKRVQSEGYMTLRIESGDSGPTDIDHLGYRHRGLEFEIARDLDKRSSIGTSGIAFVNPDSPALSGRRFNQLQEQLQAIGGPGFKVLPSLEEPVPDDVKVMLLAAPWNLSEVSAFNVDQFVTRGGRLILLLDNVNVENTIIPQGEREPRSSGLEQWLIHLGVTAEYGVAGDFGEENRGLYPFAGQGRMGPYPYFPLVLQEQTDTSNIVMASLPGFPMCWPTALKSDEVKHDESGRTVTVLAHTTGFGHRRPEIGSVGTTLDFPLPDPADLEVLDLVLLIDGPFTSMWKGKERPLTEEERREKEADAKAKAEQEKEDEKVEAVGGLDEGDDSDDSDEGDDDGEDDAGDGDAGDADEAPADAGPEERRFDDGDVRIVILGDAELAADYMWSQRGPLGPQPPLNGRGGFSLVLGLVDWLRGSEDLISLRNRDANPRRIEELEQADEEAIKWGNVTAMPFLILCIGLVVFAVRRSQS